MLFYKLEIPKRFITFYYKTPKRAIQVVHAYSLVYDS